MLPLTSSLLQLYDAVYGLEYAPLTSTHATFMAGSVFLLAARRAAAHPTEPTRPSLFHLERCSQALAKISTTWADSHKAILEALRDRWVPSAAPAPMPATAAASIATAVPIDLLHFSPSQQQPFALASSPPGPSAFPGNSPGSTRTDEEWLTILAGLSQEPQFGQFLPPAGGGNSLFAAFGVNDGGMVTQGVGAATGQVGWGRQDEEYCPTAASLGVSFGPPGAGGLGFGTGFAGGGGGAGQGFGFAGAF